MNFYIGKPITAIATGTRLQTVTCERCRTVFNYELTRTSTATASAPYYLFQRAARSRAERRAAARLEKRLGNEAELVACPDCNWVNQTLVDAYRKRMYRNAPVLIALILVVGAGAWLWAVILADDARVGSPQWTIVTLQIVAWVAWMSPLYVLMIRSHLRARVDPNQSYPRAPDVPPGTPPAMLVASSLKVTRTPARRAQSSSVSPADDPNWVIFPLFFVGFPDMCGVCLAPPTTEYRPPVQIVERHESIGFPLCKRCSRRLSWRWFGLFFLSIVPSACVGAVLAVLPDKIDHFGRWAIFTFVIFFGLLFGGEYLASRFNPPYRMKPVDADRGVFRFRALNPIFTARFREQIAAVEAERAGHDNQIA